MKGLLKEWVSGCAVVPLVEELLLELLFLDHRLAKNVWALRAPGLLSVEAEPQLMRQREAEVVREDARMGKEEQEAGEVVAVVHGGAVEEKVQEEVEREEQEETAEEDARRVESAPLGEGTQLLLLLPSMDACRPAPPPPQLLLLMLFRADVDLSAVSLPLNCCSCCCCCLGLLTALCAAELPGGLDGRGTDTEPSGLGSPATELLPPDIALPDLANS